MVTNDIPTLSRPESRAGSSSDGNSIHHSVALSGRHAGTLADMRDEQAYHSYSTSIHLVTRFLILKKFDHIFLWQLNHPNRGDAFVLPNIFDNNNSSRRTSWPEHRQRRHLPKCARISVTDISTCSGVATTEVPGKSSDTSTLSDAPHGHYLTTWARYRRSNLLWEHMELVDDLGDVNTVDDLGQPSCNGARRALTGILNGPSQ